MDDDRKSQCARVWITDGTAGHVETTGETLHLREFLSTPWASSPGPWAPSPGSGHRRATHPATYPCSHTHPPAQEFFKHKAERPPPCDWPQELESLTKPHHFSSIEEVSLYCGEEESVPSLERAICGLARLRGTILAMKSPEDRHAVHFKGTLEEA